MIGLYVKSFDILISISNENIYIILGIVNFTIMKINYFHLEPYGVVSYKLNRVIFLSDTRYYLQTYGNHFFMIVLNMNILTNCQELYLVLRDQTVAKK